MRYRISDYTIEMPFGKDTIITQGFNAEIRLIDKNIFEDIKMNLEGSEHKKEFDALVALDFITKEDFDESNHVKKLIRNKAQKWKDECGVGFVVTQKCNLRCSYCYESLSKKDAKLEIIDAGLESLFKKTLKNKKEQIRVHFTGGEASLAPRVVEYAVNKVNDFCTSNNVTPQYFLSTNGIAITDRFLDLFGDNLYWVQVSLDGSREVHDERRFILNSAGVKVPTFDSILANISKFIKRANTVFLRVSVDKNNGPSLPRLIDQLAEANIKSDNLHFYFGRVRNCQKGLKNELLYEDKEFKKMVMPCYEKAVKKGLIKEPYNVLNEDLKLRLVRCSATAVVPNAVGIEGGLYTCPFFTIERFRKGDVFNGIDKEKVELDEKVSILNNETCIKCSRVGFCGGPCLVDLFFNNKKDEAYCDKKFFEEVVRWFVGLNRHYLEDIRIG